MRMKLITDLIDAHYEGNEFAFLEYANRIVQHNHGLGRQYTAATVHNHIVAGIEKMDAETGLCVHCQESIISVDKDHWRQCKKHPANELIKLMQNPLNCQNGDKCRRLDLISGCQRCKDCFAWSPRAMRNNRLQGESLSSSGYLTNGKRRRFF